MILLLCASACTEPTRVPPPDVVPTSPGAGIDTAQLAGRAAYIATAGVSRPFYSRIESGGVRPSYAIGPQRGAGYQLGDGRVRSLGPSHDGDAVFVQFESLDRSVDVFRLSLDGSDVAQPQPMVHVDRPQSNPLQVAFSADGGTMVWNDGGHLFLRGIAGGDPVVRVAEDIGITYVEDLFISLEGGFVVYEDGFSSGRVYVARADGSEAHAPRLLGDASANQRALIGMAPGERALMRDGDQLLSISLADETDRIPLTPPGLLPGLMAGRIGDHIVMSLRARFDGDVYSDRLAWVALDGSTAGAPVYLSEPGLDVLRVLVDETGAIFSARDADDSWAIFAREGQDPGAGDGRISEWWPSRLQVLGMGLGGSVLAACDDDGGIFRLERHVAQPTTLVELAHLDHAQTCGLRGTTDSHAVLFDQSSSSPLAVPLTGGPVETVAPGYLTDLLPDGAVTLEYGRLTSALFLTDDSGGSSAAIRLSAWHEAGIERAWFIDEHRVLAYQTDAPDARWYVAPVDGRASDQPLPISPPGMGEGQLLGESFGQVVVEEPSDESPIRQRVVSYRIDGESAQPQVLLQEVSAAMLHADTGHLVAVDGGDVVAIPAWGGPRRVLLEGHAHLLGVVEDTVLVVHDGNLVALWPDGSRSPRERAEVGTYVYASQLTPSGERVVLVMESWLGPVPWPHRLLSVSTDGGGRVRELTPEHWLPIGQMTPNRPDGIELSADGAWLLVAGDDGIYGVPTDGHRPPELLLEDPEANLLGGYPPSGHGAVVLSGGRLVYLQLDGRAADTRVLGEPDAQVHGAAGWSADARYLVYRTVSLNETVVHSVRVADGAMARITPEGFDVGEVLASEDETGIVLRSEHGGDSSLYRIQADALPMTEPTALTPIDDASEQLIGFFP